MKKQRKTIIFLGIVLFAFVAATGAQTILDANLRAAVAEHLNPPPVDPEDPTPEEIAQLTELAAYAVTNLEGLQYAVNLTYLSIRGDSKNQFQIGDISPLLGMLGMVDLNLERNSISNIGLLANMTSLKTLNLRDNNISDISVLSGFSALEFLILRGNPIESVSPIGDLTNLNFLQVGPTPMPVQDFSWLQNLTKLQELQLQGMGVSDLDALWLSTKPMLNVLTLNSNQISDVGPLLGLAGLSQLTLAQNSISDLGPLWDLPNLSRLYLKGNNIQYLDALSNLTNLRTLEIENNNITDITPLGSLPLDHLRLRNNSVTDISVLSNMADLRNLDLRNNNVRNIYPLTLLTHLGEGAWVDISGNPLSSDSFCIYIPLTYSNNTALNDFQYDDNLYDCEATIPDNNLRAAVSEALSAEDVTNDGNPIPTQIAQLQNLDASGRGIIELTGLEHATSLVSLSLELNPISDIGPLAPLLNLKELYVVGNQVTDLSPLLALINLEIAHLGANPVSNIDVLSDKINLWRLHIADAQISNIAVLAGLPNLRDVQLWLNQISDISPLATLTNLQELGLEQNPLSRESYCEYIPQIRASNENLGSFQYDQGLYNCGTSNEPGVIGNWENSMDGWGSLPNVNLNFNNTVGVTRGNYSLEVDAPSDWQHIIGFGLNNPPDRVSEFRSNNTISLDVTRLVADWPTDVGPQWSNINVEFGAHGHKANGTEWNLWQGLGGGANWVPNMGDRTQTASWSYGEYLSEIDFDTVEWLNIVVFSNCDPGFTGNVHLYLDNMQLSNAPTSAVDFVDENLKQAVIDALAEMGINTTDPTAADMARLEELEAYTLGITNLTGLEYATSLRHLQLRWNGIEDLSPLSGLISLESLYLNGNPTSNISPLVGLTNLTTLDLSYSLLSDIRDLPKLTMLGNLKLNGIQANSFGVLSQLTNLWLLGLSENQIDDISFLSEMTGLSKLVLSQNQISDISHLSGLTNLWYLGIEQNEIISLDALSGMGGLGRLYAQENQIVDLLPLTGLTGLYNLDIRHNPLSGDSFCALVPEIANNNPNLTEFQYDDGLYSCEPTTTGGDPVTPVDTTTGEAPVVITFEDITEAGYTSLTTSESGPPEPTGFELAGQFYDISTTASYTSSIEISINYDDTGMTPEQEDGLQLHHYEGGAWVDVTESLDTVNNIIYGLVDSLSPFAVFKDIVYARPNVLWPVNHKLVDVTVTATDSDSYGELVACEIIDITSNEPINGPGDGNTEPDWEMTGNMSAKLRAERSGTGEDRIYTITVECEYDSGIVIDTVDVIVPHDNSGKKK
jgi:internalin A